MSKIQDSKLIEEAERVLEYARAHVATKGIVFGSPVPEFPFGGAMEIALMLALVFMWFTKKRKTRQVLYP